MKGSIRSLGNTALSAVPARRSRVNNNNYYVLSHHTLIHINFLPFPQIGGYTNIISITCQTFSFTFTFAAAKK